MSDQGRVLIAGGTGFVGRALAAQLNRSGYAITVLGRNAEKAQKLLPFADVLSWSELDSYKGAFDAIVNLAGASIAGGRWTRAKKERLESSRIQTAQALVAYCQNAVSPPKVFINASAIGFYGSHGNSVITEKTPPKPCFSHRLCHNWEQTLTPLKEATAIRLCIARLGVVLAPKGGAFAQMALPFKAKVALQNGDGQQWFSWVALEDVVTALQWMLENELACHVYNVTSPEPVKNSEFTKHLANKYETKLSATMPAKLLQLMLGEMADELILASQRVVPDQLLEEGFRFNYVSLDELLASWE
ncbi:MAG TPA: TIGR01777 family oxidoreductase [Marinagarivorans sp.]